VAATKLQLALGGLGIGMILLGCLPILLVILAFQVGGIGAIIAVLAAFLLSPVMFLLRIGPVVIRAAVQGQGTVVMGRRWGKPAESAAQDPDIIDGKFEP
jgi:hypothetical protein